MKIRHYGLLASRDKTKRLTNTPVTVRASVTTAELIQKLTGRDISICPACGYKKPDCCSGPAPPISA